MIINGIAARDALARDAGVLLIVAVPGPAGSTPDTVDIPQLNDRPEALNTHRAEPVINHCPAGRDIDTMLVVTAFVTASAFSYARVAVIIWPTLPAAADDVPPRLIIPTSDVN